MTGWLIAMERTGAVLVIQLVMNGLNIALNLWFVLGLDWGVTGVAWATLLSPNGRGLICGLRPLPRCVSGAGLAQLGAGI